MTPNRWGDPWRRFPASSPIAVEGGLTTRRQRGAMAESWWSRRFVKVLESYGLGTRMQRGRRYARVGQVRSLDVSPGLLTAKVQGSRRAPYVVTITVAIPDQRAWTQIDRALQARVSLVAHLLAGEVPPELESAFDDASTPLFPRRWSDLQSRCTCPDSANPCKHIAAVLYVFADQLDDDPWLALEWKGRTQEELLAAVGLAGGTSDAQTAAGLPAWWPLTPGEPLPQPTVGANAEGAATPAVPVVPPPVPPSVPHAVLARLDELDVQAWRAPVVSHLTALYEAVLSSDEG